MQLIWSRAFARRSNDKRKGGVCFKRSQRFVRLCKRNEIERSGKLLRHEMEGKVAEAARNREWKKVRRLVKHGGNVNDVDRIFSRTALHYAIMHGNSDICSFLLSGRADVSQTDKDGNTLLHLAAYHDLVNMCQLLVDHKADVTSVNNKGQTPLHIAVTLPTCWLRPVAVCPPLITNESVNVADRHGNRALHIAARNGNIQTIQLLVDCGADVNALNEDGQTPLHTAHSGWSNRPELISLNKQQKQPVELANESVMMKFEVDNSNHALHIASTNDDTQTVQLLVDCGADQPLHLAWKRGHTRTSCFLLSNGADVNALNEDGQTPLHTAAGGKKDCPKLCSILLKHNAKIDAVDKDGNQPLHLACEAALMSTVQHLLDCNADVFATNNSQQTALHKATCSKRDCPEVCVMLIAKGAQVNATDGNGDTSLHVAFRKGNMNTVDVLVENDADCNVVNVCGETLLHLACKSCVECVELCDKLISHGVNPHIADREGNLPLHVALKNRLAKTFGCLLQKSGEAILDDLQKVTIDKEDLVAIFSSTHEANDIDTCRRIIKFSAKLDPSNRLSLRALNCHTTIGYSLIQIAVKEQNITFCQHLIDHGASVNADVPHSYRDHTFKDPPLHLAVKLGDTDLCRLLIEHGATIDPEMRGRIGALHLAVVNEQNDVARLLLSHGADLSKVEIGGESALKRLETRGNVKMASIIQATETFPEEIVSQGETALHIYLSSCNEGSAVDVFLRVDVVGRDGAGKTSLTKSLTLQKFNRDEPSTRGVVFDPKCQIIVKEACDWTNPLTSADYTEIYEKNVVINMADTLDTPQVKDQYFKSKESEQPMKQKDSHITRKSSKQELHEQAAPVGMELSLPHVPLNGFSQELPITSQKPTTLAVPPPSVASDLLVSSQTSSNLLPIDDSRYLSDIPVTNTKASGEM
ncbi:ankyrin-2-like [Corticium candelabrum]|uniref:ankyrin-2-like n=1 Tax=Corticium candelabrum TaxID=121492 RepID=UPI002E258C62|nr:ankyrin-2-like [Corticium candelabrum]